MNILVVCERYLERVVQRELRTLGRFRRSGFRDVLEGDVDDVERFLAELAQRPSVGVSRVIPIEETFYFKPQQLLEILGERFLKYAGRIDAGESFCVRMERRGLRGALSSQEVERVLGRHIQEVLKERCGMEPRVELEDPDKAFVIQTLGKLCGIGVVSKELRRKYPFVRFK